MKKQAFDDSRAYDFDTDLFNEQAEIDQKSAEQKVTHSLIREKDRRNLGQCKDYYLC